MNENDSDSDVEVSNENEPDAEASLKSDYPESNHSASLQYNDTSISGQSNDTSGPDSASLESLPQQPLSERPEQNPHPLGVCEENLHGLSITDKANDQDIDVEVPSGLDNWKHQPAVSVDINLPTFNQSYHVTDDDIQRVLNQHNHVSNTLMSMQAHLNGIAEAPNTPQSGNNITPDSDPPNSIWVAQTDLTNSARQTENNPTPVNNPPESIWADRPTDLTSSTQKTEINPTPVHNPSDSIWVARTDLSNSNNDLDRGTSVRADSKPSSTVQKSTLQSVTPGAGKATTTEKYDSSVSEDAMRSVLRIPGPCEAEDLIEGVIFNARYLGTTQLPNALNGMKNDRMLQAQEALNRLSVAEGETQPSVHVDLFISTSKIKILDAISHEPMMSHSLRSISYVADIRDNLVIMAKAPVPSDGDQETAESQKKSRVICHVLLSETSNFISKSLGQAFRIAYQLFLFNNSIEPKNMSESDFSQFLDTQDMYHDDLLHYSKEENAKEIWVKKKAGESLGIAIVESGWGSIIPTVILANLQHNGPMERNGKFSIGDQIMSVNGTSLVGLPLQTCHNIVKGLKSQTLVRFNIVSCPPVVSVLIKRPDLDHQLGFSVQNGVICSLMRGGIAERGGVRVGHRIIEINEKSVVATPHDKIVQMLVTSVGEIQMKTMPSAMFRLLTGQEQPMYL